MSTTKNVSLTSMVSQTATFAKVAATESMRKVSSILDRITGVESERKSQNTHEAALQQFEKQRLLDLKNATNHLKDSVSSQNIMIEALQKQLDQSNQENESFKSILKDKTSRLNERIQDFESKSEIQINELEQLKTILSSRNSTQQTYSEAEREDHNETNRFLKFSQDVAGRLSTMVKKLNACDQSRADQQKAMESLEDQLEDAKEMASEYKQLIKEHQANAGLANTSREHQLQNHIDELKDHAEKLHRSCQNIDSELYNCKSSRLTLEVENKTLSDTVAHLNSVLAKHTQFMNSARASDRALKQDNDNLIDKMSQIQEQGEKQQEELKALQRATENELKRYQSFQTNCEAQTKTIINALFEAIRHNLSRNPVPEQDQFSSLEDLTSSVGLADDEE